MYEAEMAGTKNYIIPLDPETREDLLCVDRATKEDLRDRHRMYLNHDWECNTIANTTIESLIKILYAHIKENGVNVLELDDGALNFYDLIEMAVSNKKNEDAEKEGNINIKFFPGEKVEEIISDDTPRDQREVVYMEAKAAYSYPEDTDRTKAMLKIDNISRRMLSDKFAVILPNDYMAISATCIFLENMYRVLVQKLVNSGKSMVSINFNDIVEFHAIRKENNAVDIKLRPGMGAKLIIKSDESTEYED